MQADGLGGAAVGDPAVADILVLRWKEELIRPLEGSEHRWPIEQPGRQLQHGFRIVAEPMQGHDQRGPVVYNIRGMEQIMAVQAR